MTGSLLTVLILIGGLMLIAFVVGAYVLTTRPEWNRPTHWQEFPVITSPTFPPGLVLVTNARTGERMRVENRPRSGFPPGSFVVGGGLPFAPGVAIPVRSNPLIIDVWNDIGLVADELFR